MFLGVYTLHKCNEIDTMYIYNSFQFTGNLKSQGNFQIHKNTDTSIFTNVAIFVQ